jgi:hypothetical protein
MTNFRDVPTKEDTRIAPGVSEMVLELMSITSDEIWTGAEEVSSRRPERPIRITVEDMKTAIEEWR